MREQSMPHPNRRPTVDSKLSSCLLDLHLYFSDVLGTLERLLRCLHYIALSCPARQHYVRAATFITYDL